MRIFVNDTPVDIISEADIAGKGDFDKVIDAAKVRLKDVKLKDDVLVRNATEAYIKAALDYFSKGRVRKLDSITFAVKNLDKARTFIKQQYKVVEAAGGLVRKDGKVLMIFRLGKWDLPKGKIEKKESAEEGAVREVTEECSVKVRIVSKICHTWHTYTRNKKKFLKKTYWYLMECLDDAEMKPQAEEDIEEVKWMTDAEAKHALYNSYFSIRYVFRTYLHKTRKRPSPVDVRAFNGE